jgi:hypothetical protein
MSKKVVSYLGVIPPKNTNQEKPQILSNFCIGVNLNSNDRGILHEGFDLIDCDLAVIQGFVHEQGKVLPHLILRKQILEKQAHNKKNTLIADSNLFLYSNTVNPQHYLRYSLNGIFPTTGFYFDKNIIPERWTKISKNLNLDLKPWRKSGNHILICAQRNGGWSMQGYNVIDWIKNTINEIRKHSDRPIIVRGHPGDKKTSFQGLQKFVKISTQTNLIDDLRNSWATITYNSSPGVASAIEGIPVFVLDKNFLNSQASDVANKDLQFIEAPKMPERQTWIEKISMSHWNFEELKSGEAWAYIREYV